MDRRYTLALILAAVALGTRPDGAVRPPRLTELPALMVWAWERPDDLRRLPSDAGVAFLAQTLVLDGERVIPERRRQPLKVAPETPLAAVTRIEHRRSSSRASLPSAATVAALVADTARLPRVRAVQVDFDATASERGFYRGLLNDLRTRVGPSLPISITALASWCVGDRWLDDLPVDEAVPMLFRMGPFHEPYRALAASRRATHGRCARAVGVALDEPMAVARDGRRVYVFSPAAWSDARLMSALELVR